MDTVTHIRSIVVLLGGLLLSGSPALAVSPGGIGVLGDSYSDEYQFYPPDRSRARNWMEILAETRHVNFGRFSAVDRGTPRHQGYEFNWARSDATTDDLIAEGQHTGLAAQVARGEVGIVFLFIGGNDFIHALQSSDPRAALDAVLPRALDNFKVASRTILDANRDVKLVVATVPDIRNLPEFDESIRAGAIARATADAYTRAIGRYNAQVRALAIDRRAALLDLDLVTRASMLVGRDHVKLAGRRLDRSRPSNDPSHVFLADRRHMGTIGQGVLARMFLDLLNVRFGAGIAPLTDEELVGLAESVAATRQATVADR